MNEGQDLDSKSEAEELLSARLIERNAKLRMSEDQIPDHDQRLSELNEQEREIAEQSSRFSQDAMKALTDNLWTNAMIEAGVPAETILKVWDLKDEGSRKANDLEDDSQTAEE